MPQQVRPRGEVREQAIVQATLELLGEVGYERLTMDAVATRARASKATIYRRWSGKRELAAQALRVYADARTLDIPATGCLRDDLVAILTAFHHRFRSKDRTLFAGLIHAMQTDPELARIVQEQIERNKCVVRDTIVARAADRGERCPNTELISELAPVQMMGRLLITGEPTDPDYIRRFVDTVLLPLLRLAEGVAAGDQQGHGDQGGQDGGPKRRAGAVAPGQDQPAAE